MASRSFSSSPPPSAAANRGPGPIKPDPALGSDLADPSSLMDIDPPLAVTGPTFLDDDPNDPIVKELPVYLSSTLVEHLHLFQFPVRSRRFTPETGPATARIKPKSRAIELDIPLNTVSPSYDQDLGVQFGGNAQLPRTVYDQQSDGLNLFASAQQQQPQLVKKLEALTLASTTVPPMTQYYVAAMRDDEVHLTPIKSTVQFTPKLKHIDDLSRADRDAKRRIDEEAKRARGELTDKKPSAAAALPRIITDDMKQALQRSVAFMKKEQDEEPFVPLRYYHDETVEADQVYGSLFAKWKRPIAVQGQPAEYLSMLVPPAAAAAAGAAPAAEAPGATKPPSHIAGLVRKPGSVTRQDLKTMSLEEQVACLMANAHVLPLPAIRSALPKGTPEDLLLVTLRQLAIPVRATLWVARSELVYKGRERYARDYLIGMFVHGAAAAVSRKEFADVAKLDVESVKRLLSDIAELRQPAPGSKQAPMWYLKHLDSLPSEEQASMHEAIHEFEAGPYQTALKELGLVQHMANPPTSTGTGRGASARNGLARTALTSTASAATNAPAVALGAPPPTADPVSQAIIQLLLAQGVVTETAMRAHLTAAPACTDASDVEVLTKLNTLCFHYHGAYALKTRPGSKYEAFRQVALDLFARSPAVKKNELIKTFKERTGKDIAVKAFEEVVAELAAPRDKTSKKPYLWKTAASE